LFKKYGLRSKDVSVKKTFLFFYLLTLLLFQTMSSAETIVLQANKDTYVDFISPDQNFGQSWKMLINGSSSTANGLVHFDFNSIPAIAQIEDATLTFLVHANSNTTRYLLHPLTSRWEEDSASWNQATETENWNTAGGDYQSSPFVESLLPASLPYWMVTDVTSLIADDQGNLDRKVAENGLLISADTHYSKIVSREFKSFQRAETCHSCHGTYAPILDLGKSTECAECHAEDGIPLPGEPSLRVNYTLPPPLFQFAQISDTHIGRSSQQSANLYDAVALLNDGITDFVLFTGDLTDRGELEHYSLFKEITSNLTMPFYCVPGDNDVVDTALAGGTLERYREQLGDDYYSFDFDGITFIGINNTSVLSLDPVQRLWLEEELTGVNPKLVFAHKALFNLQDLEPLPEAEELLTMLDNYNVFVYMNGDDHESNSITRDATHFIWCDNLSYGHLGDTFNLYQVYPECILLYHIDIRDGSKVFAAEFPIKYLPDLTIRELSLDCEDQLEQNCAFTFTVENEGSITADESTTCLMREGTFLTTQLCPSLGPGESYESSFAVILYDGPVQVCADCQENDGGYGLLEEENEENNCIEISPAATTTVVTSSTTTTTGVSDHDDDGIPDDYDNCIHIYNPDQANSDSDPYGDACDNCPFVNNADQVDSNGNGIGDACESSVATIPTLGEWGVLILITGILGVGVLALLRRRTLHNWN
jgi:hypothetical protein